MNFLLSSFGISSNKNSNKEDDTLTRIRSQTYNARQHLEDAMDGEDNSVNAILKDSGIEKGRRAFDYDEADRRRKELEVESKKRREEREKRIRAKELQLFPDTPQPQMNPQKQRQRIPSFNPDDSLDATTRKHNMRIDSRLAPSPLPATPPENVRRWKEKLKEKKYELPSQEEERLQKELAEMQVRERDHKHQDSTEEVLARVDKAHTSFEDDHFYSLSESPVKMRQDQQIKDLTNQLNKLRHGNEMLESRNLDLSRDRDYWKHKANLMSLEIEQLAKTNEELNRKLTRVLNENRRIYQYSSSLKTAKAEHEYQEVKQHERGSSDRITFNADDTTQLIKYATKTQDYEPILF